MVANILDAESMAVWKDVDGVLNADPKIFPDAVQIAELNYLITIRAGLQRRAGIHPKTIKPLQNKNIPLYVRPFGDKRKPGTVIRGMSAPVEVPILILKKDQVLLTIRSRDFSFVLEEKFATIFSLLERFRIKTNLIHNSAVNLSLCVDNSWHIDEAIEALREAGCDVMKAENMELLTVRGYTDELWRKYARGPGSSCGRPRSPPCAWFASSGGRSLSGALPPRRFSGSPALRLSGASGGIRRRSFRPRSRKYDTRAAFIAKPALNIVLILPHVAQDEGPCQSSRISPLRFMFRSCGQCISRCRAGAACKADIWCSSRCRAARRGSTPSGWCSSTSRS